MANKKFWLGILVMTLVFGMTVVGCDDGSTSNGNGYDNGSNSREEYFHNYVNYSSYSITVYTYLGSKTLGYGDRYLIYSYSKNLSVDYSNSTRVLYEKYDRGNGTDYYFYDR